MSIKTEVWGKSPKGKDVHKFTMTNAMGASVTVMEWGAICVSIIVPEGLANLGNTKGRLLACGRHDIGEVDEDALGCLWA